MKPSPSMLPLLAVLTALAATPARANLLINGSFESGAFVNQGNDTMSLNAGSTVITGWTVVTDTTAWIGPSNPFGLHANDGSFFLDLTNYETGAPFAGLSQVVATIPGAVYSLSFDLGSSTFWGRPDSITASAAGTSINFAAPLTGTNNDWQHETMSFTAVGATTTVTLQGATGIQYIGLDNASVDLVSLPVTAVPEPDTWGLLLGGVGAVGLVVRRRTSGRAPHEPA
jgi:Protein of unknown function (DUF642)/PEP-CTERM motif